MNGISMTMGAITMTLAMLTRSVFWKYIWKTNGNVVEYDITNTSWANDAMHIPSAARFSESLPTC